MASLAREVAFGAASGFKTEGEFTAPIITDGGGGSPRLGRSSYTGQRRSSFGRHISAPVLQEQPMPSPPQRLSALSLVSDEEQPLLLPSSQRQQDTVPAPPAPAVGPPRQQGQADGFARRVRIGINASWAVNVLLLVSKAVAFAISGSYSVLASAVDSLVDLLSQGLLAVAEYQAATFDPRYPIGRTRMAELSVIGCAVVMFISTALVIREAGGALWEGFHGHIPELEVGLSLYTILGVASALKLALWLYCRLLQANPIMLALAQDHLNDVMSNVAAVVGATIAQLVPRAWWADAGMALLFAAIIIWNWFQIVKEQTDHVIGLSAPEELIEAVTQTAETHHPELKLDRITAYHHGAHYVVELEVVLPEAMSVRNSHDIALELQHKVEAIESVERAYVHVDYCMRSELEHKMERNLKNGLRDVMQPLPEFSFIETPAQTQHLSRGGSGALASPHGSIGGAAGAAPQEQAQRSSSGGAHGGAGNGVGVGSAPAPAAASATLPQGHA